MRIKNLMLVLPLSAALVFGVAACSSDSSDDGGSGSGSSSLSGQIAGAGASSQEAAMQAWIANFQTDNPDVTISYDPVGSGGGREQFVAGATPFGGTDAAMEGSELKGAQDRCGGVDNYVEIPVYVSPIAVAYNLDGVDDLNLTADTLAKIMKGDITTWNDQAIANENPDADLPDTRITPVHRSDESGTTENFVGYLSQAAPDVWDYPVDGNWPVKGGEAAQGTSGVISAIKQGSGTIGYADLSQVGDLNSVNIGVGGEFVAPSAEAAAEIFSVSKQVEGEGKYVFAYDLDRSTVEKGIYPISLVSYEMACTKYDSESDGTLVQAFYDYIASEDGQNAAAEAAGSAPITSELRNQIQPAIDAIGSN
ncbi:MAG: phosphate ABC transporter substrate-binding protein PstS [Solirubrobacterales bacterium]|nr:phosphate ABC transporter substrate-binding protein PstS [Solirubrobacterales bacterium]